MFRYQKYSGLCSSRNDATSRSSELSESSGTGSNKFISNWLPSSRLARATVFGTSSFFGKRCIPRSCATTMNRISSSDFLIPRILPEPIPETTKHDSQIQLLDNQRQLCWSGLTTNPDRT
jgi:hypothetical protein